MTEINYKRYGDAVRISVSGHAGFNPGNDPVCAGISAITYQLINSLILFEGKVTDVETMVSDGVAIIVARVLDEGTWDIIWKVIQTGYAAIEMHYPEYVHLVGVNEDECCDK